MNLQNLGLLKKAGKIIVGRKAIKYKKKKIKLIILARDLSYRSKRDIQLFAEKNGIDIIIGPTMSEIGKALGSRPVGIVGVCGSYHSLILGK